MFETELANVSIVVSKVGVLLRGEENTTKALMTDVIMFETELANVSIVVSKVGVLLGRGGKYYQGPDDRCNHV